MKEVTQFLCGGGDTISSIRNRVGTGSASMTLYGERTGSVHHSYKGGGHGMRVDKVGVGDVGEVHGGARGSGHTAGDAHFSPSFWITI